MIQRRPIQGDCAVQGNVGFVSTASPVLQAIDLSNPRAPSVSKTIPTFTYGFDTSVTPDGKFVVSCGGRFLSVVDIASKTEIIAGRTALGMDCLAVDACRNGYVLVNTDLYGMSVHRKTYLFKISGSGNLTYTGRFYEWGCAPMNVVCSPNGKFAVGAGYNCFLPNNNTELRSLTIPGLREVSKKNLTGLFSLAFNKDATSLYALTSALTSDQIYGYKFNSTTGEIEGALAGFPISVEQHTVYSGIDQMAVSNDKIYVGGRNISYFDAANGRPLGTLASLMETGRQSALRPK